MTGVLGEVFNRIVGETRWAFSSHAVPRGKGYVTADIEGTPQQKTLCYQALAVDQRTLVPKDLPNPDTENAGHYKVAAYSLKEMIGNIFAPIAELLSQAWHALEGWIKAKFQAFFEAVKKAAEKAKAWVTNTVSKIKDFFSHVVTQVWESISHGFHSHNQCIGETKNLARKAAPQAVNTALGKVNEFLAHVRQDLSTLQTTDRRSVIDAPWAALYAAIWKEINVRKEEGAHRVRDWFTKGSSKDEGSRVFRQEYQSGVSGLDAQMKAAYTNALK